MSVSDGVVSPIAVVLGSVGGIGSGMGLNVDGVDKNGGGNKSKGLIGKSVDMGDGLGAVVGSVVVVAVIMAVGVVTSVNDCENAGDDSEQVSLFPRYTDLTGGV